MVEQSVQQKDGGSSPTPSLHISAKDFVIVPCEISVIRDFIEHHHYSHNLNGVKISFCFSAIYNNIVVGAIVYGQLSTTAWKKFGKTEKEVLELRRLVFIDNVEKNAESRMIGYTLRWIKRNAPEIKVVVSYADPAYGHSGIIYKASNFVYLGLSRKDKGFIDPENGRMYHSRALRTKYKGDYRPFVKKLRKKQEQGKLVAVDLPRKHCYVYVLHKA